MNLALEFSFKLPLMQVLRITSVILTWVPYKQDWTPYSFFFKEIAKQEAVTVKPLYCIFVNYIAIIAWHS